MSGKECCGLPMNTLDVFGIRLHRCMYLGHHPLVIANLSTGEEVTETYRDGDGGLEWTSHYGSGEAEQGWLGTTATSARTTESAAPT